MHSAQLSRSHAVVAGKGGRLSDDNANGDAAGQREVLSSVANVDPWT